jgi:hypothetical protein
MEAHGGIYALHAHLNHACAPNAAVRHLDARSALARISVVARGHIARGEELLVAYVDPALGVHARRDALRAWAFGVCRCVRCLDEEAEAARQEGGEAMEELERELKAGLGLE